MFEVPIVKHIERIITVNDLLLTPLFLFLIYIVAILYRNRYRNTPIKKYFLPGLTLRFVGCLFSALMYNYLYGNGDTFDYWRAALNLKAALFNEPLLGLELMMVDEYNDIPAIGRKYTNWTYYLYKDTASVRIAQIGGFLSLFTFNSYLSVGMILSFFSFLGCWKMFEVFYDIYPHLHKKIAIATLFIPSVFFWGSSGLLKDTITTAALGYLIWSFYHLFIKRKKRLKSFCYLIISAYFLIKIKIYIILAFAPAITIWLFIIYSKKIRNNRLRRLSTPFFILVMLISAYLMTSTISSQVEKYSLDNILATVEGSQAWMEYTGKQSGASFNLGNIDYSSPLGLLKAVPLAINATLFRPYLWEARKPVLMLSSIEALFFLLFTIYTFLKVGIFKTFKYSIKDPSLLFCLVFSLAFAFAVGFSTFNFGALARYKIPCLPFYLLALFILLDYAKRKKRPKNRITIPLKLR